MTGDMKEDFFLQQFTGKLLDLALGMLSRLS